MAVQESEKRRATCRAKLWLAQGQLRSPAVISAHLGDTSDVLPAIFLAKPKVLIQAKAHIIAIKPVGGKTEVKQVLFESYGNGRFTASGEAGEPKGEALLAA